MLCVMNLCCLTSSSHVTETGLAVIGNHCSLESNVVRSKVALNYLVNSVHLLRFHLFFS